MGNEISEEEVALRNYEKRPDIEARASFHARENGVHGYRAYYSGPNPVAVTTENIELDPPGGE